VRTCIPWPPGKRELKFTYVLRNAEAHRVWERPLDLPCSEIHVRVPAEKPDEVACDLGKAKAGSAGEVVFESIDEALPAGHLVRVTLGRLPVPWTAYA
jgi:hypothetical protein